MNNTKDLKKVTELPSSYPATKLHEALLKCAAEIGPVHKEHIQGLSYSVRSWETVLNRIAPILTANGIIFSMDDLDISYRQLDGGTKVLLKCLCTLTHVDGEFLSQTVYGSHFEMFRTNNGRTVLNNNPEGAARTYAARDFLCRVLLIATDSTPEETDGIQNDDVKPNKPKRKKDEMRPEVLKVIGEMQKLNDGQQQRFKAWCTTQKLWYKPSEWSKGDCDGMLAKMALMTGEHDGEALESPVSPT